MTDPSPDCGYTVGPSILTETEQTLWEEILRLREFGEHYSGAAQDAWDRIEVLEKALAEIVQEEFQAFDHREGYMQHLARCGYVAHAALAAGSASPGRGET